MRKRKKDESESESRVQVAGFEHHIIIGFPFFKTDQWMCKLQEDINIFFFSFESVEIKSVAQTKLKLQWC